MKKPKAIFLYLNACDQLELLSDAQAGRLIKALLLYANTDRKPDLSDDLALNVMFTAMSAQIDRDFEKYNAVCEKRSKAGKVGASVTNSKAASSANAGKCRQEEKEEEENKKEKENEYEYKEEKEEEAQSAGISRIIPIEFISSLDSVVGHLNKRADAHFRSSTLSTAKVITDRLREGYTADDCIKVIDCACAGLLENGCAKNLLPYFLFGSKFKSYLKAAG